VLVDRFLANDEWQSLYTDRLAELRSSLYDSGIAAEVLDEWEAIVTATGLIDAATIDTESSGIAAQFG
jgi:spore coat protein CotH